MCGSWIVGASSQLHREPLVITRIHRWNGLHIFREILTLLPKITLFDGGQKNETTLNFVSGVGATVLFKQ